MLKFFFFTLLARYRARAHSGGQRLERKRAHTTKKQKE